MGKFSIEERVRWSDVDAAAIIFYGSYIRFFEFAESEMFRSLGHSYGKMFDQLDIWLPRRHIECEFLKPARLDDLLQVSCWVSRIGETSLTLGFEVRIPERGPDIVATASYVLVAVARGEQFDKVAVPPELIRSLAIYRG